MGRPKGSKNPLTKMIENGNIDHPVKKVKNTGSSKNRVATILSKDPPKKKFKLPEHILPLEYPFFIKAYSHGWVLCEAQKPIDGHCMWNSLCYTSGLQNMLRLVLKYSIRVPMDVQKLSDKIDHVYNMIEARVADVNPKDLFTEYAVTEDFLEDFA